jgi:hypothetical protein
MPFIDSSFLIAREETGHFDLFYSQPEGYAGFYGRSKTHSDYIAISMACIADLLLFDEMQVAAGDYTNPHFATFTFSVGEQRGMVRATPLATYDAFKTEQVIVLGRFQ